MGSHTPRWSSTETQTIHLQRIWKTWRPGGGCDLLRTVPAQGRGRPGSGQPIGVSEAYIGTLDGGKVGAGDFHPHIQGGRIRLLNELILHMRVEGPEIGRHRCVIWIQKEDHILPRVWDGEQVLGTSKQVGGLIEGILASRLFHIPIDQKTKW